MHRACVGVVLAVVCAVGFFLGGWFWSPTEQTSICIQVSVRELTDSLRQDRPCLDVEGWIVESLVGAVESLRGTGLYRVRSVSGAGTNAKAVHSRVGSDYGEQVLAGSSSKLTTTVWPHYDSIVDGDSEKVIVHMEKVRLPKSIQVVQIGHGGECRLLLWNSSPETLLIRISFGQDALKEFGFDLRGHDRERYSDSDGRN